MDIAAMSISLSAMKTSSQVGVALFKKTMDSVNENANMMIEAMKQMEISVNPHIGGNFDMRI